MCALRVGASVPPRGGGSLALRTSRRWCCCWSLERSCAFSKLPRVFEMVDGLTVVGSSAAHMSCVVKSQVVFKKS